MIYSTNRVASLGDTLTVDVNESYFGAGSLLFAQESAQDELELFEAAIKSDIDEVLIGESSYELQSLNEGFIENAKNKIKELMKKFIEWIKGITRSVIAKLSQIILRDNKTFCKQARKMIAKMKNSSKFKYSGKALDFSGLKGVEKDEDGKDSIAETLKNLIDKVDGKTMIDKGDIESKVKALSELNLREEFEDKTVIDVTDANLDLVYAHLKYLEDNSKATLTKIKTKFKKAEVDAKKLANKAEKIKVDDNNENAKKAAAFAVEIAAEYKSAMTQIRQDSLYILRQSIKIARAVVTKAMGASPKNEGVEYSEELIQAMIESFDYEIDEAFEEMSEGKEVDIEDDDFDDDEE